MWTRRRFNFRSRFEGGSKVAFRVDGVPLWRSKCYSSVFGGGLLQSGLAVPKPKPWMHSNFSMQAGRRQVHLLFGSARHVCAYTAYL